MSVTTASEGANEWHGPMIADASAGTCRPGEPTAMNPLVKRVRSLLLALCALMLNGSVVAQFNLPSAPAAKRNLAEGPPAGPLVDCSLYRYGNQLDQAILTAIKTIGAQVDRIAAVKSVLVAGARADVTDILLREGLLQHDAACTRSFVRGYIDGASVQIEIDSLQPEVCLELLASPVLRLTSVSALHKPSGRAVCGGARNPIPKLMTLGRLTLAGRMMPGDNTVTVSLRGPFSSVPSPMAPAQFGGSCPSVETTPNPVIEDFIENNREVTFDQPPGWNTVRCYDFTGGPSSVGACTTAQWETYHRGLVREFDSVLARAQPSNDPARIYSAARWLIRHSNPSRYTIRSFDYEGSSCDVIRNRFVAACGLVAWDVLATLIPELPESSQISTSDAHQATDELDQLVFKVITRPMAEPAGSILRKCFTRYNSANSLIDRWLRPPPFPAFRLEMIGGIEKKVQAAMERSGYGNCPYYGDAVYRLDQSVWKREYDGALTSQLPIDWEHSFRLSAVKCLTGK